MKKNLLVIMVAAVAVCFAMSAYAIHETPADGQKFPLAGADASKLYDFITEAQPNYSHWNHLPGTSELSASKEPHGAFESTYVNKIAMDSMKNTKGMADGSIIVMENYDSDKKLEGCTVMYKISGYNPQAGDWFWVNYAAPGGYVVASGKVESCISCHSDRKANDFLFSSR
ncbi:MAG: cytochrome P460 family protein [Dissulfurispiraceae bacterium]|jgi:hypothetical protein